MVIGRCRRCNDENLFELASARGKTNTLRSLSEPDFEILEAADADKTSYSIIVNVDDGDTGVTGQTSITITITITDVDEPGEIEFDPAAVEANTTTIIAKLTDPDGDPTVVRWHWSGGGNVASMGATSTYTLVAADAGRTLRATATYLDGTGDPRRDSVDQTISVPASDNNDPELSGSTSLLVFENRTSLSVSYSATDADTGDTLTYSVEGTDAADFSMNPTTGATSVLTYGGSAFDYETKRSYALTIKVTDGQGGSAMLDVTLTIIDQDEDGELTLSPAAPGVGETIIAMLEDDDTPFDNVKWRWSGTGVIAPANAMSYTTTEANLGAVLTVRVTYTDRHGSGQTATAQTPAIAAQPHVPDIPGTVTLSPSSGLRVGGTVMAILTDPDVIENTLLGWQWKRDGADITGATSESYTAIDADVDTILTVTVTYTDAVGGEMDTAEGDVGTVLAYYDTPGEVTFDRSSVTEGETVMAILTDPDVIENTLLGWQWKRDGADITGATSESYTAIDADVDTILTVTVTYTDAVGGEMDSAEGDVATVLAYDTPGEVTFDRSSVTEGETVMAILTDPDVIENTLLGWQWKRDGADITGATSESYTAIDADVDTILTVTVTYTDAVGGEMDTAEGDVATVLAYDTPGEVTFDRSSVTEGETVTATLTDPDANRRTPGGGWQWNRRWH